MDVDWLQKKTKTWTTYPKIQYEKLVIYLIYYINFCVMVKNKGLFLQHYVFAPQRSMKIERLSYIAIYM